MFIALIVITNTMKTWKYKGLIISFCIYLLIFSLVECYLDYAGKLTWNTCFVSDELQRIHSVSLMTCIDECRLRPGCFSFNYYRWIGLCEVNDINTTTVTENCPGSIFSLQSEWQIGSDQCSSSCDRGKWCDVSRQLCITKECGIPSPVTHAIMLGKRRDVGSIRKYICTNDRSVTSTSRCDEDGNWSGIPVCLGYPVEMIDGARWQAFWWYTAGSGWPADQTDVLGEQYGSCDPDAPYCFGRLPPLLTEDGAELLAKDSAGTIYRWAFDGNNPTAHAVWLARHDHSFTLNGQVCNQNNIWNPVVIAGSVPNADQDCFMYRVEHGVASFLLDDDNCDCLSTLSFGHGMCLNDFNPNYGTEYSYGADLLYDPGCASPSPDHGLILFFRDEDDK